jgi:hypothetical protein
MAPARVMDVIEYEIVDGEIREGSRKILIANTVMEGELNRNYPDGSFVGKSFLMRSYFPQDLNSTTGKKAYKVYEIVEVAVTGGDIEGKEVVADGTDPVSRSGKQKG